MNDHEYDFRPFAQRNGDMRAFVSFAGDKGNWWLATNEINIRSRQTGLVELYSSFEDLTTTDGGTAYAFYLPVIGWTFDVAYGGSIYFEGWISSIQSREGADRFCIRDPSALEDTTHVERMPAYDEDLHAKVSGRKIYVSVGLGRHG